MMNVEMNVIIMMIIHEVAQSCAVRVDEEQPAARQHAQVSILSGQADDRDGLAVGASGNMLQPRLQVAAANDDAVRTLGFAVGAAPNGQLQVAHDEDGHDPNMADGTGIRALPRVGLKVIGCL